MPYDARRGGHAPGHIRGAFLDWIERGADDASVCIDDDPDGEHPVRWILGQLWNCTDVMPGVEFRELASVLEGEGIELRRSSYAAAVRAVAQRK